MTRADTDEQGQAVVLLAIVMAVLLISVGLAIDTGQVLSVRRTAQEAADAAAYGGALVIYQGGTTSDATTAARTDATYNGFSSGGSTTVTVNSPPASGTYTSNTKYVEVIIQTTARTKLLPAQVTTITARGVAGAAPYTQKYAVLAIDQGNTSSALQVSSNGTLALSGAGSAANSSSSSAAKNDGTVTVNPSTLNIDVVGGTSGTWPNPRTGRQIAPDPYAGTPKPTTTGLLGQVPACSPTVNQPGIYTQTFGSNCAYILAPGTYILKGGGIDLAGNSSLCTGTTCSTPTAVGGVFFFLTKSNYPASGGTCATFKLTGNNASTLSATTSGTYKGMLVYQDAQCTADLQIGGNGAITATGTIYAPGAKVAGNGNNSAVNVSQIVAKTVGVQNANFTIAYDAALTAAGSIPALVE